jgi:hypothetical protein
MHGKVTGPLLIFMILMIPPAASAQRTPVVQGSVAPLINIKTVPAAACTQNLPFFCRQELKLQKASGLPVYIRLGSKEYVDKLEHPHGRMEKEFGIRD